MKTVVLVRKIGAYHDVRFAAASELKPNQLHVIEYRPDDPTYQWKDIPVGKNYERILVPGRRCISSALDRLAPAALVCVGYSDPEIHEAIYWALSRRVKMVVCSDTTAADWSRTRIRETFKRTLLRAFTAALVAGQRSKSYLVSLGMPMRAIFHPWDVVDNDYFASEPRSFKRNEEFCQGAGYFLCVGRFVPEKNLEFLIRAYARYHRAGRSPAPLLLVGGGPLECRLRWLIGQCGLSSSIRIREFLQGDELRKLYRGAEVLILPSISETWGLVVNEGMAASLPILVSNRCGCAEDLVVDGRNGFTFDPCDETDAVEKMEKMASFSSERRCEMGKYSRALIEAYSPTAFAKGFWDAVKCAVSTERKRGPFTRLAVHGLVCLRPAFSMLLNRRQRIGRRRFGGESVHIV